MYKVITKPLKSAGDTKEILWAAKRKKMARIVHFDRTVIMAHGMTCIRAYNKAEV